MVQVAELEAQMQSILKEKAAAMQLIESQADDFKSTLNAKDTEMAVAVQTIRAELDAAVTAKEATQREVASLNMRLELAASETNTQVLEKTRM